MHLHAPMIMHRYQPVMFRGITPRECFQGRSTHTREAVITVTTTPAPTTSTDPTTTPHLGAALGMVGRVVSIPGTHHQGVCLTVDGPTWHVVSGADGTAHLFMNAGHISSYETPVAECRWNSPVMGLPLLSVDFPDLARGVTLIKATDPR